MTNMYSILLVKRLKHKLLSINHLCDKGYTIIFNLFGCVIEHKIDKEMVFKGCRVENVNAYELFGVLVEPNS